MGKKPFQGKTAIVTGASSGIGLETAVLLAGRGTCVALAARGEHPLQQLAHQIQQSGQEALAVPTDVTQQDQVERLVQETLARWGRVDYLVSNAGQYIRSPILNLNAEDMEKSMAVNFYGHLYAIQAVLPHMLAQHSGHIVLVSSMNGKKGLPPDAPYVAAKFAMSGLGEVLRQELYGSGVQVTLVFPGRVDTPLIKDLKVPWIQPKIPPERVARAILNGIERRQAEIYLPFQAKLFHFLNVFSPSLADWVARFFHLEGWVE